MIKQDTINTHIKSKAKIEKKDKKEKKHTR